MVWRHPLKNNLFDTYNNEVLFKVPVTMDSTGIIPRFFKHQFCFNATLACLNPYRLILRGSVGLKRCYFTGELSSADEVDYQIMAEYSFESFSKISDELVDNIIIQGESYDEISECSTNIRAGFDNLQFDISRGFYSALQRSIYSDYNLSDKSRGEISDLIQPLKESICA